MDEIIDEFYEKLNFPSLEKLFKAISAKHKDIKKSDVKLFLDSQNETHASFKSRNKNKRNWRSYCCFISQRVLANRLF